MIRTYAVIFFILLSLLSANAQKEDAEGKRIIETFTKKTQSYAGVTTSFTFTLIDLKDQSENSYSGTFNMKGEKYVLKLNHNFIYFNGTTLWNYLPDEEEVNISTPENNPAEATDFDNPVTFFSLIGKDFFNKFIGTDTREGKAVQVVDLYPKDLNKPYSRIRLQIFKETHQLYSARYFGKDGIQYILKLTEFHNKDIPDSFFSFDTSKHPEVEIIDLR